MIYIFIILLCILIIAWLALLGKAFKVVRDSHIQLQRSHLKLQTSVIDIVKDLQEIHKLLEGIQADYLKILQKDFDYLLLRKQVDYLILEKEKESNETKKKSSVVKKTTKKEKKVEDK